MPEAERYVLYVLHLECHLECRGHILFMVRFHVTVTLTVNKPGRGVVACTRRSIHAIEEFTGSA